MHKNSLWSVFHPLLQAGETFIASSFCFFLDFERQDKKDKRNSIKNNSNANTAVKKSSSNISAKTKEQSGAVHKG